MSKVIKKIMQISEAFGDIAQTIAMLNPAQIVDIKASKEMSDRVEELVLKKNRTLLALMNQLN